MFVEIGLCVAVLLAGGNGSAVLFTSQHHSKWLYLAPACMFWLLVCWAIPVIKQL
jgi:hypothetical protein